MFTWLFRKETTEQKQKKEIDSIVKAMCRSVTEEGRWNVTVKQYKTLFDIRSTYQDVFAKDQHASYNIVEMVDTKTGWCASFSVLDNTQYRGNMLPRLRSDLHYINTRDQQPRIVTDMDELVSLSSSVSVFSVVVENHSEYENIPSDEQLKEVYDFWWWKVVASESQRRYEEKQKQKQEQKQTAIDKLKQMYL